MIASQFLQISKTHNEQQTHLQNRLPDSMHSSTLQNDQFIPSKISKTVQIENENIEKIIASDNALQSSKIIPSSSKSKTSVFDFDSPINTNLKEQESDAPGVYEKRMKIRDTFIDAYTAYDDTCHGQDELIPIGPRCHNWVGMGLTMIDAVDTMYIMVCFPCTHANPCAVRREQLSSCHDSKPFFHSVTAS